MKNSINTLNVSGTLVVVIPNRDGLVVAADSRSTVLGHHFDGVTKLHIVDVAKPMLLTITGTSDFADAAPSGVSLQDWMPVATYQYRGSDFVKSHLETQRNMLLSVAIATQAAEALAQSLNAYFQSRPNVILPYIHQELCRLALGQCINENAMQFASIVLAVDAEGRVHALDKSLSEKHWSTDEPKTLTYIGEDSYTTDHVLSAGGARLLDHRAVDMWKMKDLINDLSSSDAAMYGEAIVRAAEETTRIIPVPSGNGIGGPVALYLIRPTEIVPIASQFRKRPAA